MTLLAVLSLHMTLVALCVSCALAPNTRPTIAQIAPKTLYRFMIVTLSKLLLHGEFNRPFWDHKEDGYGGALLSNPVARKVLCVPEPPLRFCKLMDAQHCLVINLSKGQLGADTANVMGGLLLASLVNAAFSRADTESTNRTPFILYVDEFHHFSTGVFADALSECRKYGLGAVLAQQYTTQTDRDVLEAIFGNVGTILALRVGALDAPMIAKQLLGVSPEQLILQPSYRAFVQMILRGQKQMPFSADLHPPRRRHQRS